MIAKALVLSGGLGLLLTGGSALAHHSHNMYDSENQVSLEGVVKDFEWTNPHAWLYVVVTDEDGNEVEWALEGSAPTALARKGWTPKSLSPGEKVTVTLYPLRTGEPGGNWKTVTSSDGTVR